MAPPWSPPTRRVVAVVELIAESQRPLSVSVIAARLSLARATVTAVLNELRVAQWVTRDDRLCYRPGPALARLSVPEATGPGTAVRAELAALAEAAGCGATLSRIDRGRLTVVAKHYAGERIVPGLAVGQTIPLAYPAGAAVMPWRGSDERTRWSASTEMDRGAEELLRFVTDHGFAMFRPDTDDAGLVELLTELLGAVGAELLQPELRAAALRQLARLTARPYTEAELGTESALPIGYISAPVLVEGDAPYEVQLGPLRSAVGPMERARYIDTVRTGAQALSVALRATASDRGGGR